MKHEVFQWYTVMMWNETSGNAIKCCNGMKHGGIKWYIVIIQWYIVMMWNETLIIQWYIVMMFNETPGNAI